MSEKRDKHQAAEDAATALDREGRVIFATAIRGLLADYRAARKREDEQRMSDAKTYTAMIDREHERAERAEAERDELLHQQAHGYPSIEEVGIEGLCQRIKQLEAENEALRAERDQLCEAIAGLREAAVACGLASGE